MTSHAQNDERSPAAHAIWPNHTGFISSCLLIGLVVLFGFHATAKAHGGKTHTDKGIAAFEALQVAMNLYDRLLTHGKLDQSWETDLVRVEITPSDPDGDGGYTIHFQRSSGDPGSVYFFLTLTGEYAGSNFTGP